jgi:hypothetical protein
VTESTVLARAVREFVDRLQPALAQGKGSVQTEDDGVARLLLTEARQLSAAFMCADSSQGMRELIAFRRSFGGLDPAIANGPITALRDGNALTCDKGFIDTPSPLFQRLAEIDRENWSTHTWDYYEAALGIGHAILALAEGPTRVSLEAVDRFRSMLLVAMKDASPRPQADPHSDHPDALAGLPGERPSVSSTLDSLLDDDDEPGLRPLSACEVVVADSADAMQWVPSEWGMQMTLARDVPDRIAGALRWCVTELYRRGGFGIDAIKHSVFAVHPGGPRIIDRVRDVLELDPAQVRTSCEVLRDYGNMASATLPHVWLRLLGDPRVPSGTLIPSFAFGPGLTVSGALLQKQ